MILGTIFIVSGIKKGKRFQSSNFLDLSEND